ncbi:MAG: serine/threonine-protein kinase [Hyphomonadaceae bacterium]
MTASLELQALELLSEALDQPAETRAAWVQAKAGTNAALATRVMELLKADAEASNLIQTGGASKDASDDPIPDAIGAYRITGLIGQGGMGAVYKGERAAGDFEHEVAIKVIRPGVLSESLIERFQLERQTLANLNHKHIARLFDGGDTASGDPYIVMEYVDGDPITVWADANSLSQSARLDLFGDVCSAVRYAHQNLVIHRDITPSNILVTSEGDAKLIDFGIAKPQDPDSVDTGTGSLQSLTFTPGYAAPERSRGAAANTLSDVYSLGKILEALTKDGAANPDLDAIVVKATITDPDKRYASVDALMDDLANFSKGYAVEARAGGAGYRFGKFFSRRKLAVTFGGLAVFGLAGALGVTSYQYQRAEAARAASEVRFGEVRELTNFLLFDLYEDLSVLPGTLPIMEKVTDKATDYLDILSQADADDTATLRDLGMGHYQLAQVLTEAGGSNLGDPEAGVMHLEESVRILSQIESRPEAGSDIRLALADARHDLGYVLLYSFGDYERSAELLGAASQTYETERQANPDDLDLRLKSAMVSILLRYTDEDDRPYDEKKIDIDRSLIEFEALSELYPGNVRVMAFQALSLRYAASLEAYRWQSLSDLYAVPVNERARYELALDRARQAVRLMEQVLEERPDDPDYLYQFIWSAEIFGEVGHAFPEWHASHEASLADLMQTGAEGGAAAVREKIETDDAYAPMRLNGAELLDALDKAALILARLEETEADQFSFKEAKYTLLAQRAYVVSSVLQEYDEGIRLLTEAAEVVRAFHTGNPDFRNAYLELALTLNEAAFLQDFAGQVYAQDRKAETCALLEEAESLWVISTERWGPPRDYADDRERTTYLRDQVECN